LSDGPNEFDDEFDDDVDYNRTDGNTVAVPTAQAVLEYLVRQIVDDPDAVQVEVDENGRRPSLNVHVAPGDMGRVIGKRGRVAQSIRTVVRAAAVRDGREIEVEFVD
jgi:predicted RNA-binding protein YlqC (UPF0109 family)